MRFLRRSAYARLRANEKAIKITFETFLREVDKTQTELHLNTELIKVASKQPSLRVVLINMVSF